jgi:hypothetical protein
MSSLVRWWLRAQWARAAKPDAVEQLQFAVVVAMVAAVVLLLA